jgi:hypothetical protein
MKLTRARKKICSGILAVVAAACAICTMTLICRPLVSTFAQAERAHRARERLLCETDYQTLLDAGRELLRQLGKEEAVYVVGDQPQSPVVRQFPKPILDLAPKAIRICDDGHMVIEMFGNGFYHCGAYVYSEDFESLHRGSRLGHRMLINGLWYYDDEYETDPKYGQVIDALIERGRKAP